jgi:thiosulfate/3-mercaptopyruvate sulfurtransferase
MNPFDQLLSVAWLREHLHDENLRIFDATYHLPGSGRDAASEFSAQHIPHAAFFDINTIADPATPLPHMLPDADTFARAVESMGMRDDSLAVIYDTHGLMSAARLWWMFRVFGHSRVAVLDGGLPAWIASGASIERGPSRVEPAPRGAFTARFRPDLLANQDEVLAASTSGSALVLDARSDARFHAKAPEPRPGVRPGHIPGSANLPYTELIGEGSLFREAAELSEIFARVGVAPERRVITLCGSGVTACVLALGLARLGRDDVAVYDGSWSEWGSDPSSPVATES